MNKLAQESSLHTHMRKPSTSTTHKESSMVNHQKSSALKVLSLSSQYKTVDSTNDKQYQSFGETKDEPVSRVNPVPVDPSRGSKLVR
jgi:hypothetical protein